MKTKLSITLHDLSLDEALKVLSVLSDDKKCEVKPTPPPEEAPEETPEDETPEDVVDEEIEEIEDELDEEDEDEAPKGKAKKGKKKALTRDDVVEALRTYAKNYSREEAIKILKRVGKASSVLDLSEDRYSKVVDALV